jgi:hypothetical protein
MINWSRERNLNRRAEIARACSRQNVNFRECIIRPVASKANQIEFAVASQILHIFDIELGKIDFFGENFASRGFEINAFALCETR